ncbi:hypothetical protein [Alteriqipengyuania sp. 357]
MTSSNRSSPRPGPKRKNVRFTQAQKDTEGEGPLNRHWRTYFLQELAATSNVAASAQFAGVSAARAYKTRREHADFAADWRAALFEGYEHLEMEVLACLRGQDPQRKIDIANAIRLLAAHRAAVVEERARRGGRDEAEIFAALDRKLAKIRSRRIAPSGKVIDATQKPAQGATDGG